MTISNNLLGTKASILNLVCEVGHKHICEKKQANHLSNHNTD